MKAYSDLTRKVLSRVLQTSKTKVNPSAIIIDQAIADAVSLFVKKSGLNKEYIYLDTQHDVCEYYFDDTDVNETLYVEYMNDWGRYNDLPSENFDFDEDKLMVDEVCFQDRHQGLRLTVSKFIESDGDCPEIPKFLQTPKWDDEIVDIAVSILYDMSGTAWYSARQQAKFTLLKEDHIYNGRAHIRNRGRNRALSKSEQLKRKVRIMR